MGKPVGIGGPWKESKVKAGVSSDPYLMTGYDKKKLSLHFSEEVNLTIETDLTGDGNWVGETVEGLSGGVELDLDDEMSAYWIRFTVDKDCTASAILTYE